jgi:hypothetical protein
MDAIHSAVIAEGGDSTSRGWEAALTGIYEVFKIPTRPARVEETLPSFIAPLSSFLDRRHGLGAEWNEQPPGLYFDGVSNGGAASAILEPV